MTEMSSVFPAVFAGLLLGAGIFSVMQIRKPELSSVNGRIFWLVAFLSFVVAGFFAVLRLFVEGVQPVYGSVLGFATSVGFAAVLIGVVSHLVRPLPERWTTIILAIPVVVYVMAVLSGQIYYMGLIQVVLLIGMTGLAAWKFESFPRASIWLLGATLSFALLPALLARLAPGLGLNQMDVGHLAMALGIFALVQVAKARGIEGGGPEGQPNA